MRVAMPSDVNGQVVSGFEAMTAGDWPGAPDALLAAPAGGDVPRRCSGWLMVATGSGICERARAAPRPTPAPAPAPAPPRQPRAPPPAPRAPPTLASPRP